MKSQPTNRITGTGITALSTCNLPMIFPTFRAVVSNNIGLAITFSCHSVTGKSEKVEILSNFSAHLEPIQTSEDQCPEHHRCTHCTGC